MSMLEEIGQSPAPECWDFPHKSKYWTTFGTRIYPKKKWPWSRRTERPKQWNHLYYTKEDAEAYAVTPHEWWEWAGGPASQVSLSESMMENRQCGGFGVRVFSYQNGKWTIVKEYPAGVPVPLEERD